MASAPKNASSERRGELLARCQFPSAGVANVAFSGGADSSALLILAGAAGLDVVAHHVRHDSSGTRHAMAQQAAQLATQIGAEFVLYNAAVPAGANFEARARAARQALLPSDAMFGHTADDRAETVLLRMLRGTGPDGLAVLPPSHRHPIVRLRRHETVALCATAQLDVVDDPTNIDPAFTRNRVRHELLPLLGDISTRDVVPLLNRLADLAATDRDALESIAAELDPTDTAMLASAPAAVANRALRAWIEQHTGYPPDRAAIERIQRVIRHEVIACEIGGGIRIERSAGRLRIVPAGPVA